MVNAYIGMGRGERRMKGYVDLNGFDRPACISCKYKNKMTVEEPCYSCVSSISLSLHKPNCETEFTHYEKEERKEE